MAAVTLDPRPCDYCGTMFRPVKAAQRFHARACKDATDRTRHAANRAAERSGVFRCLNETCPRSFTSEQARRTHVGLSHPALSAALLAERAPKSRTVPCDYCGEQFATIRTNARFCPAPKTCRRLWHNRKGRPAPAPAGRQEPKPQRVSLPPGIPRTTVVLAALECSCPKCGRVYTDAARRDHHVHVTHDPPVDMPHEVAVAVGRVWALT